MTKPSLTGGLIAVLTVAGTLSAQPDPVLNCRKRAAALINATVANTSARQRGGLDSGDVIILWQANLPNNHVVAGFCEARPQTGRIVRLGADQGDLNRATKITRDDAERICEKEARARFSPGNGLIGASLSDRSKSTYTVEWGEPSMAGTVRKGRCEIDSYSGHIRKFKASVGW
jgi:hypothetical protein